MTGLPHFFGPYQRTALVVALHRNGPMLGRNVREFFSENIMKRGYRAYQSKLVERIWLGPARGYAFSINRRFRARAALDRFLDVLSDQFALPNDSRESSHKISSGDRREDTAGVDGRFLFGSQVRTATLIALEALGGEATSGVLVKAVRGQHPSSVKNVLRFFIREGVLSKTATRVISTPQAPWSEALRALLRDLAIEQPEVREYALSQAPTRATQLLKVSASLPRPSPLFTYANSQRFLVALAANGPSRLRDVIAASGSASEKRLRRLIRIGVLCRFRIGRDAYYSLNAAHPIYSELRALLRALSPQLPLRKPQHPDGVHPREHFEIERLFGPRLSTNVLISVAAAPREEIDASSIFRLLPEHDRNHIGLCLDRYERIGVVTSRRWKTLRLFKMNERWPAYRQLGALLRAIARKWSDEYLDAAALLEDLQPDRRRRMEAAGRIFGTYSDAGETVA